MSEPHSAEEALLKRIKEALSKKKTSIQRHALELAYQGFFPIPVAGIVLHRETSELECSCQNFLRFKAERDGLDKPEICGAPGKHPTATNWPARASRDPDKIMALFDPKYNFRRSSIETGINVGIVTGPDTGLVVLDIDGPEGFANLKKLEAENAPLPETIRVVTGSGGLHYYWRSPPGVTILNSVSRIAPKIDFRGQHGQCLAPPSKHKSGGFYEWAEGHSPNDLPLADMPDWLIKLAIEGGEKEAAASAKPGKAKKTSTKSRAGKSRAEGTGWRRFLAEIGDHEGGRGFNAPIGEAILSYFATNGPDADATELLDAIADAVDCAEKDPEKPRSKYERGSEYLNDEVAKAREKIRAQRSEAKAS